MKRCQFLATALAAPLAAPFAPLLSSAQAAGPVPSQGWRTFEITTKVSLRDSRAEVHCEGYSWFPLDPADVRKAVLEQEIALDSSEGDASRERMFGHWEMNWVGYNSATDIVLPGDGSPQPDFSFLLYPCARTSQGHAPCLDPARFHYEITSRELPA